VENATKVRYSTNKKREWIKVKFGTVDYVREICPQTKFVGNIGSVGASGGIR